MAQDDATFGAPGGEPTPTPEAAPPIPADFMSSVMARFARQDEVQKTTNDHLATLVAALTTPDGQKSRPQMIRRHLFNTNPTATGGDHISDDSEPNETLPAPKDDGEDDSSADEEQPANRMRIEDDNSSGNTDLWQTLNARKSQRTLLGSKSVMTESMSEKSCGENTFTKNRRKTRTRLPRSNQRKSWSLRSDRARTKARSLRSDQALAEAWSLRGDRAGTRLGRKVATELSPKLGRYVATKLSPKLGRYVATEHVHGSVAM
ncbi:hypothetical protein DY000_02049970 [Brassica cretica]|uniref:DUF4005 domain-containing protein n=1 Tax=Brassica cretica TaxID=69181 RepID=A0ABQ7EXI5_BRACR|nr:hypothetical protein DY000_02049970 [Brassica cretica]